MKRPVQTHIILSLLLTLICIYWLSPNEFLPYKGVLKKSFIETGHMGSIQNAQVT
jgi:hypothetical protein